jgi:hypothetical protein
MTGSRGFGSCVSLSLNSVATGASPGRDNNMQCECLFLSDGDYGEFRSDQIAVVIVGLDPVIHLFRKKMDARVNPRIKSGDAHDAERAAGGVQSRLEILLRD